jgi:hypothetical protein
MGKCSFAFSFQSFSLSPIPERPNFSALVHPHALANMSIIKSLPSKFQWFGTIAALFLILYGHYGLWIFSEISPRHNTHEAATETFFTTCISSYARVLFQPTHSRGAWARIHDTCEDYLNLRTHRTVFDT